MGRRPGSGSRYLLVRIMEKVVIQEDGCWIWTGHLNNHGYGTIGEGGKYGRKIYVHRALFEMAAGYLPPELDHLCRVRACVNPQHLEPVSHRENHQRGSKATATHCKNGHEYTPENVYIRPDSMTRMCRTCQRINNARSRARARAD